jgi:hypothetical protein
MVGFPLIGEPITDAGEHQFPYFWLAARSSGRISATRDRAFVLKLQWNSAYLSGVT